MKTTSKDCGFVVWFTGLPSSGKTTLARALAERLVASGRVVDELDGDLVREVFPSIGFSREERDQHIKQMGFLASRLERVGVVVLASFVSPYRSAREFNRHLCRNFIEVYLSTPLPECEKRDVKGLYRKARAGEVSKLTGLDDPYEVPQKAELVLDTSGQNILESVDIVWDYLLKKDLL